MIISPILLILTAFAFLCSVAILLLLLRLNSLVRNQQKSDFNLQQSLAEHRNEMNRNAKLAREELLDFQGKHLETSVNAISQIGKSQQQSLDDLRKEMARQMESMQKGNEAKLEKMRETVDEKLQSTLEKRLGESFKLVSERLEAVHKGLGDMQNLASDVGGLKQVLTNVKARGTWGEYQLEDILSQVLAPAQFEKNVKPKPTGNEIVEFAICLPGTDEYSKVYLPIDSKFPVEDYQRLISATEVADKDATAKATRDLISTVKKSAKDIQTKYIAPPYTTDFAILFLPSEGLYAEVLRQPALVESLQNDYRIMLAGPTTLAALLNSLRLGFRTLAIEQKSSEVWQILSAVKTEFGKFGGVLDKVKRQLQAASNTIDATKTRTRVMENKLTKVEHIGNGQSEQILGLNPLSVEGELPFDEADESEHA